MAKPRESSKNVNNRGLVLLNKTDFTGASTVSVDNVFSATYDNYLILLASKSATGNPTTRIRLRVSGADDTNNTYSYRNLFVENTISQSSTTGTNFFEGPQTDTNIVFNQFWLSNPFNSDYTSYHAQGGWQAQFRWTAAQFTNTTSFTGFTVFPSSSTITGTVKVYGYKDGV